MNPSDDQRDPLDDAYRKASVEDAGRPGAATRNAILAEAAAAARRRTPAANESRYLWRGVAGVAVLGFAVLLWQQMDHGMPGTQPMVAAPQLEQSEDARSDSLGAELPAAPPSASPFTPQPEAERAPPRAASARSIVEEKAIVQAPAPSGASAAADAAGNSIQAMQAAEPPRAAAKMSAAEDARTDPDALLRLNFPQQYQSTTEHSLWLVRDGSGVVLRSGELPPGKTLAELRLEIEQQLGGRLLRPWRVHSLSNARGQSIQLAVAQTP